MGRLTVTQEAPGVPRSDGRTVRRVECVCDCGTLVVVRLTYLRSGTTKSCGCLAQELTVARSTTHGQTARGAFSVNYRTWGRIKERAFHGSHTNAARYAGRGIGMYGPWVNDFPAFDTWVKENLGPRPKGCSIDRINNDGNYEPGNLRWATAIQQNNNRRDNILLEHDGEVLTLSQLARKVGLDVRVLWSRLFRSNWPLERALTEPLWPCSRRYPTGA